MTVPRLQLTRYEYAANATYGRITDGANAHVYETLELPWLNNARKVSCIPLGEYACHRRWSPRHHIDLFEIGGVEGRTAIEIHPANFSRELLGCVALGMTRADIDHDGIDDVTRSKEAFGKWMQSLAGVNLFLLAVVNDG